MDIFLVYLKAFLVGGIICAVGQLIIVYTNLTPARILVSFVCFGVLLGAFGVYDKLIDFAGAGASVPLLGFGNTIAKGTKEAIQQNGVSGILTGGLTSTAGGITASIVFGLLVGIVFKPKDKA